MKVSSSGDVSNPEVVVSGQAAEFVTLGKELVKGILTICLESEGGVDQFYPVTIKALKITFDAESSFPAQIRLDLVNQSLLITGDSNALRNLGSSLINVFTGATSDEHMHLEHYAGNQLVGPSGCTVVLTCAEVTERRE